MPRIYYDEDAAYFKRLEAERIELSSPDLEYYSLNRGTNVDVVYNEPDNDPLYGGSDPIGSAQNHETSWNFYPNIAGGESVVEMPAAILYQEAEDMSLYVREEGKGREYDAQVFISMIHWDCAIDETSLTGRLPKEDDVVYIWSQWWDVIKAAKSGYVLDSPTNTGYRLDLKIRTQFTPDRKINR